MYKLFIALIKKIKACNSLNCSKDIHELERRMRQEERHYTYSLTRAHSEWY